MKAVSQSSRPDWLREPRLELGQPAEPVVFESPLLLLFKGSLLGVALVLMPFAGLLVFEKQLRRLDREVFELASVESRVGDAQTRLKAMAQQREALNQQTKRIADQLVAVRSGSALLEQLRQVTPQGVRLLTLAALPTKLVIQGEAEGADGFERINALALNLEALDDVLVNGTSVVKATSKDDGLIDFSLDSALNPSVQVTPERLRDLGSEGLARRYELLHDQGIDL